MRQLPIVVALLLAVLSGSSQSIPTYKIKDFVTGSYAQILAANAGQPMVLALWSLDCEHCPASLRVLADVRRRYPTLTIVLVSTDTEVAPGLLHQHVSKLGLGQVAQWRFAEPLPERLRMDIDPRWWGELPRNYLIDTSGERTTHTGVLDRAHLERWLVTESGSHNPAQKKPR